MLKLAFNTLYLIDSMRAIYKEFIIIVNFFSLLQNVRTMTSLKMQDVSKDIDLESKQFSRDNNTRFASGKSIYRSANKLI